MTRTCMLQGVAGLCLLLSAGLAVAQEGQPTGEARLTVLVFNLEADAATEALAKSLTDEILLTLGKVESIDVSGQSEIALMLDHEKDKQLLLCKDDRSCLARISSALSANKAVLGRVGMLGNLFVVTLKLTDTEQVSVESGESVTAENEAELPALVAAATRRLLGLESAEEKKSQFKLDIAPEGTRAAVLDLQSQGVPAETVANLTDLLSLELKKFKGLGVVSRSEIESMLQYQTDKLILQCESDTSCLVEIGGALGVDYLVSGGVGKLGASYVLSLKLLDIHTALVSNRVSETFEGDEAELARALRFAARNLLGRAPEGTGSLAIVANVDKGTVTVDGAKPADFPLAEKLLDVQVGKHGIDMGAEGYFRMYKETYVEPGRSTQLRFELNAMPKPWYRQWWVWTVIGTVVAGGAVAIIWAATDEPGSGTVNVTFE